MRQLLRPGFALSLAVSLAPATVGAEIALSGEGASLQINPVDRVHAETLRWIERSAETGRPWVVHLDEIGPASHGVLPDADDPDHDAVRHHALWGNLMAGGGGCEWYFGYEHAHNDLGLEDLRSRDRMWDQTRHAVEFFHAHLPFTEMSAADAYVRRDGAWALAKPGRVYAVYLPPTPNEIRSPEPAELWLPAAEYSLQWYDPRNGGPLREGWVTSVKGPGYRSLGTPPGDPSDDWVALVQLSGDDPEDVPPPPRQAEISPGRVSVSAGGNASTVRRDYNRRLGGLEAVALDFSRYDTRHYPTRSVREGYALWSRLYDMQMDGNLDLFLLDQLTSIDWTRTRSAVDLACGSGRIGAWLAARRVEMIAGVDLTPEMLELARAKGLYRTLHEEDMCATSLPDQAAGLVVNCLAISHVPELLPAYREAHRLLRPGGWLILIGYHPFFLLAGIPTHFHDRNHEPIAIQNHVHLIGDHVNAGASLGLVLLEMRERIVDRAWVSQAPSWERHLHKPASFAMVWRKPPANRL
jgi:SAM-dependent methyltransferase